MSEPEVMSRSASRQVAGMDRYDATRGVTPAFLERVATWIGETGEVRVILRYLRAAGAKDFALCRTRHEFESLVKSVPRGTDIEVFRDHQLPIRGMVDDAFVKRALRSIPDGDDYLLLTNETQPGTTISRFWCIGGSHIEFRDSFTELMGAEVALGPCPNFYRPDHEGLISAAKDGIDGPR